MWDHLGRWRGVRPTYRAFFASRCAKQQLLLDYIKEQFFDSYEGEWEEMLQEAHLHLYPDYDPHEDVAYITVVDVRLEGVNDAKA